MMMMMMMMKIALRQNKHSTMKTALSPLSVQLTSNTTTCTTTTIATTTTTTIYSSPFTKKHSVFLS